MPKLFFGSRSNQIEPTICSDIANGIFLDIASVVGVGCAIVSHIHSCAWNDFNEKNSKEEH